MAIIEWNQSFSVGNMMLDSQHKQLFLLVNQLHDGMVEGHGRDILDRILDQLVRYTATHFADEERAMQRANYPDLAAHKAQHDALKRSVLEFQANFRAGKHSISVQVMTFLKNWLTHHIEESDRKYVPFLKA